MDPMVSCGQSYSPELGSYCWMEVMAHHWICQLYFNQLWLKSRQTEEVNNHDLSQALISSWWVDDEVSIAMEEMLIWFHFLEKCLEIDFVRNLPNLLISGAERIPSKNCTTWISSFFKGQKYIFRRWWFLFGVGITLKNASIISNVSWMWDLKLLLDERALRICWSFPMQQSMQVPW